MVEVRPWPRRWLTAALENPFMKLGSLFIAVIAWMYVQGGQVTEAKVRASVDWRLPPGLTTTEPLPQTVAVQVKGSRSATRRAQRPDVAMTADLTDLGVGEHSVEIGSLEMTGLVPGVSVTGYAPSTVRLVLDSQTARKVRVKSVTVGDPVAEFSVIKTTIEPSVIEITGPRIVLSDLTEVSTRPIDVSGLSADIESSAELDLPYGVRLANGAEVRVKVDIEPLVERRTIENVPLIVQNSAFRSDLTTVDVTLQGPAAVLRALGAGDVTAMVVLPDPPGRARYDIGYGPTDGPRLEILRNDSDEVKVIAVRPAIIPVARP